MKDEATRIVVENRQAMNLLGLLMEALLRDNLASRARRGYIRWIRGDLRVQAGKMTVTLRLDRGRVQILPGARPGARAWIKGSLGDMLDLLTLNRLVGPVVARHVCFGGNPIWMVSVLPLLVPDAAVLDRLRRLVPGMATRK